MNIYALRSNLHKISLQPPQIRKKDGTIKERKPVTQVYHPIDDLHLTIIDANESIIQRCGRHIIRMVDSKTKHVVCMDTIFHS